MANKIRGTSCQILQVYLKASYKQQLNAYVTPLLLHPLPQLKLAEQTKTVQGTEAKLSAVTHTSLFHRPETILLKARHMKE